VPPVLEQLARRPVGHPVQQSARVGAEAAVQRQVVRAHQNIDRVELELADAAEHPAKVPDVDRPGRARVGEALRGEGDPADLRGRERFHRR